MDESDVDDFFEGVAGKPGQGQPTRASHRLGATVRAAVLRGRESADGTLSAADELERDSLLDSLDERGLFRDPDHRNVSPLRPGRFTKRTVARWSRPVALAAILAVCAVGVLQLLPASRVAPVIVERGSAELTLRSDDPAGAERELTRELTQAGAKVQAVQINDSTWTLSIELPRSVSGAADAEVRDRVRSTLAKRGVAAPDADSLSIVLESTARH